MISKFLSDDFYRPDRFVTGFDTLERGAKQFNKGMEIGKQAYEINIAINDTWSARIKRVKRLSPSNDEVEYEESTLSSYEKLGYHANTCDLLKGFISSGCKLIVHREINGHVRPFQIQ